MRKNLLRHLKPQEYIDACNECRDAQRAVELLRIGVQLAEDDIRVHNIAERMKDTIERERAMIKQYAEQVERLNNEISDLAAELEDKRIQLAELGSLSALIGRLERSVGKLEKADKPVAAEKQQDKPKVSQKKGSKKAKGKANGFDEFWAVYPNKKDKQKSRQIWDKLAPDAELKKQIVAAIKQQAKSEEWQKEGGKFIPYPSTWLRNRRWEDDITHTNTEECNAHSYDVDKILQHAKSSLPKLKEGAKDESKA